MKKDLPWFKHYNSTHNEPIMQALISEYSHEGYGRYWILCEKIASSPNALLDISNRVIKLTVVRDLGMNAELFDSFIEFLSAPDINLIRVENNIITSNHIQEDYCRVVEKRITNKTSYQNSLTENRFKTSESLFQTSENIQMRIDEMRIDENRKDEMRENTSSSIFYEDIKELAKKQGFNINENQAQNFKNRLEPSLLTGKYNFIDYAAEKVKNSGKPEEDHIKLFIKTCEQKFFIDEFPKWREKKEEETAAKEKRRQEEAEEQERQNRINQAKENYPIACDNCGASLDALDGLRGSCSSCGWDYSFNEEQESWEFYEHRSLTEEFNNIIRCKNTDPDF